MSENPEYTVDQNLLKDDKGRKIQSDVGDSTWGQLIFPSDDETASHEEKGMKVVLFASYIFGYLLMEALKEFIKRNPGWINIVGLVTDDPASPDAKISKKRRIWRLYDEQETVSLETTMIESGLKAGIPVYTGAVKTEFFRQLIKKWNPDVILTDVFGQIIDAPVINYPKYGIYNFHPADLLAGHGAGPQPFQDLIDRDATTTKLTIHQLTVELDAGPIVGQSPPVNVRYEDGSMPDNILIFEDKVLHAIDIIGVILIKSLIKHYRGGSKTPLQSVDFISQLSQEVKDHFMQPVPHDKPMEVFPVPSKYVDYRMG
jgi:folate-dependent phosphoribosylglycinamide formyltransferase PurN